MKTVLLHGLGQTATSWKEVKDALSGTDVDCPELFAPAQSGLCYPQLLAALEQRYADTPEPLHLCGLSLGGMLALDYAIRHGSHVHSLVLIGVQYKVPRRLLDFQNFLFRWMPDKMFADAGLSKADTICLTRSMRALDFSSQLKMVHCPVTVVCGEKDFPNRAAAKKLARLLPQAELRLIPGASHEVNQCAPQAVLDILRSQRSTVR